LADLARQEEATLADWVVQDSWLGALSRMTSAVEAWSRHGPGGDGTLDVVLDSRAELAAVERDGVGWMSVTTVRQPRQGPAA
jgi:hypothetical protein